MSFDNFEEWTNRLRDYKKWKLRAVAFYIHATDRRLDDKWYQEAAFPISDIHPVEISELLIGYAFELALKGRILEKKPNVVKIRETKNLNGQVLELSLDKIGGTDGHDLCGLVGILNLSISERETKILNHYTEMVRWRARYPIENKVKSEKLKPLKYSINLSDVENLFYKIIGDEYRNLHQYFERKADGWYKVCKDRKEI